MDMLETFWTVNCDLYTCAAAVVAQSLAQPGIPVVKCNDCYSLTAVPTSTQNYFHIPGSTDILITVSTGLNGSMPAARHFCRTCAKTVTPVAATTATNTTANAAPYYAAV